MSRYIDADALIERILKLTVATDDLYGMGITRGIERAETAIEMQPTADVVEVRHGHWIEHPQLDFEGGYSGANYECSNCHYADLYDLDDAKYCYCPNCGAKMDGGRREG